MLLRSGEVFNHELLDESLKRIDQTGQFETIDGEKDVDYRSVGKKPELDLTIHLKKKAEIDAVSILDVLLGTRAPSPAPQARSLFAKHPILIASCLMLIAGEGARVPSDAIILPRQNAQYPILPLSFSLSGDHTF
jgi:hypothetical protein